MSILPSLIVNPPDDGNSIREMVGYIALEIEKGITLRSATAMIFPQLEQSNPVISRSPLSTETISQRLPKSQIASR